MCVCGAGGGGVAVGIISGRTVGGGEVERGRGMRVFILCGLSDPLRYG